MFRPVISFFSGAMGLDLGLMEAGLDIAVGQELDRKAIGTISANGHRVVEGDLRALLEHDPKLGSVLSAAGLKAGEAFAVAGGPPCQPFSTAGRRLGVKDKRGLLIFDYIKAIQALQPRFAILENVKGLASACGLDGGALVGEIIAEFSALGYAVVFGVLDAVDYGAPQFRERLIVVASRDNEPIFLPAPTHFQRHQNPAYRWCTLGDTIRNLEAVEQEFSSFSAKTEHILSQVPEGGNWRSLPPDIAESAMGGAWKSSGGKVGFFRRLSYAEPSPTLVTSPVQKATMLAHPTLPRPLSVLEYTRLQGFPENWVFAGSTADKYRQIGNAVPVALGRALGEMLCSAADGTAGVQTKRKRKASTPNALELTLDLGLVA